MSESFVVTLSVPARAEYLSFCRLVLAGLATVRAMSDEELADLKLVLTEACANVVKHAYDERVGTIDVVYELPNDRVSLMVADEGRGFAEASQAEGQGLGLRLIETLTDTFEIEPGANGRGTVLRMSRVLEPDPEAPS